MFMLILHILCHNLVGYESSRGLGTKLAECGYETSEPGYESSGIQNFSTRNSPSVFPYLVKLTIMAHIMGLGNQSESWKIIILS